MIAPGGKASCSVERERDCLSVSYPVPHRLGEIIFWPYDTVNDLGVV
jgi:hypothetical protein